MSWGALGQSLPTASTLTDIYTAPGNATIEVVACNRGSAANIRLSHAIGGAADTGAQYLIYDYPLGAGESKVTSRFTVKATDKIRAWSDSGAVAFNLNGIEED